MAREFGDFGEGESKDVRSGNAWLPMQFWGRNCGFLRPAGQIKMTRR